MEFNFTDSHSTSIFTIAIGVSIFTAVVHIIFAVAVYRNAARLKRSQALAIAGVGPQSGVWLRSLVVSLQ
ncbi:hypothetical protein J4G07_16400 [Candidatus Poribacteria bacterium]|nr:hypothetical protein [Candidatus Poribacteria bacterium]